MKIIFVCLGNICRSPMAEYLLKDKLEKLNIKGIDVVSRATSNYEIGNPIHRGTAKVLDKYGINYSKHHAARLTLKEYEEANMVIYMDESNYYDLLSMTKNDYQHKLRKLLEKDVADPWYTGNFIETERDILKGIDNLINEIKEKQNE